jgi:CRP-like cAMP-binding protein
MIADMVGELPHSSKSDGLAPAQAYPKGVQLFRQGNVLDEVLLVRTGVVKLARAGADGRESIVELAFGEMWLGAASVIVDRPSPVSAITCTETMITRIPANDFRRRLQESPALSLRVHEAHARELVRQTGWIDQLGSLSSRQRLELMMRKFISASSRQTQGGGVRLDVPLRHWELARLIAVSPEHLSRLLRQMEQEGVIERSKGWVVVSDVTRLSLETPEESSSW